MTQIIIDVANDNEFNTGWLAYVLGLPEPDAESSPDRHDGWVMGRESGQLKGIRKVFEPLPGVGTEGQPYGIRIKEAARRVEVIEAVSDV